MISFRYFLVVVTYIIHEKKGVIAFLLQKVVKPLKYKGFL